MPSKWDTDIAGFSFPSPSPRILVKEAMTTLINAVYERDNPTVKNGATNYTSKQLSNANFIMQEFIDNCESCFTKYLNLNKVDGDSVTSDAHTWNKSSLIDANADGFVEMGLFNGEDYSFFSDFNQIGFFLSEDILKKCYEIIGLLKWRIGEKGQSSNVNSHNFGGGTILQNVKNTFGQKLPFPSDIYRDTNSLWGVAINSIRQHDRSPDPFDYTFQIGEYLYNQSEKYIDATSFTSGMPTICLFNSAVWDMGGVYDPIGSIYSTSQLNTKVANEQTAHYSLPLLIDMTQAQYNLGVDSVPFPAGNSGWFSCQLEAFQMFFDIDNDTILDYYTP